MKHKLGRNQKFGKWTLDSLLGQGGNGSVWLAHDSQNTNERVAIKFLNQLEGKSKRKLYLRFKNEIEILRAQNLTEGVLEILDYYLPEDAACELPWYAMPVAETLEEYLANKSLDDVIKSVIEIGETLIVLHSQGISHRDIKPANMLFRNGRAVLADFGLADHPDKQDITSKGDQIGAKWTIAPEMKRDSYRADGKPADIYSLAKTLWILLTGIGQGFEGQYNNTSVNSLSKVGGFQMNTGSVYLMPLDKLLHKCTDDQATARPLIGEFVDTLRQWIVSNKDFRRRNPLQWRDVQNELFPTTLPKRAIWEDIQDIAKILDILGRIDNLNHMLFPGGGGLDMLGAQVGVNEHTVEIAIADSSWYLVKPRRLIFESFNYDWEWNYFRLENHEMEPIHRAHSEFFEETMEIAPAKYVSIEDWFNDREGDCIFPEISRHIVHILKGDIVILQKTSTYNKNASTYDGRQSILDTDGFREYIARKIDTARQISKDEEAVKKAEEMGVSLEELVHRYLDWELTRDRHNFQRHD